MTAPRYFLAAMYVCPMELPRDPVKKLEISIELNSATDPGSAEFRRAITDATEQYVSAFVGSSELVTGFMVSAASEITKTWVEPVNIDSIGATIWGLTCETWSKIDSARIFGWYELDVHVDGMKITITAEADPPGRQPGDLRNAIAEVGMHGLSSNLLNRSRQTGTMRKLPGKPGDCFPHAKRLSDADVRVWKVLIADR